MDLRCPEDCTPLKSTTISSKCKACYEDGHDNKQGYTCDYCNFYVHEECINPDIPSRHQHPLELTSNNQHPLKLTSNKPLQCCLCRQENLKLFYQCSQCDFLICIRCTREPLIFNDAKAHKHELHQVPMKLSFTCNACGLFTSEYPCICHQCCFIIHRKCISLPRVININRHDHRISHVSSLGPREWICGVCYEPINAACGAYSCLICSYAVHSQCAIRPDVWDDRELEGIPEEEEEGKPFEVIDQNLIKHFCHQHNLKVSLGLEEYKHCYACTLPFKSERCYICTQCDFIIHDACANLSLRKRHPIYKKKLTLCAKVQPDNFFVCGACVRYCTDFSYDEICVKCASINDAFKHASHSHWLFPFRTKTFNWIKCTACDILQGIYLRCGDQGDCGGFNLCFRCATLPTLVRHKYDDHPLSLYYGEKNGISTYCCGICEEEINLKNWFYWCRDCDSILHTECVFNNLLRPRLGYTLLIRDKGKFDLLPNDSLSRPICYLCKTHCMGDLVLNDTANTSIFMCSSCVFPDRRKKRL